MTNKRRLDGVGGEDNPLSLPRLLALPYSLPTSFAYDETEVRFYALIARRRSWGVRALPPPL